MREAAKAFKRFEEEEEIDLADFTEEGIPSFDDFNEEINKYKNEWNSNDYLNYLNEELDAMNEELMNQFENLFSEEEFDYFKTEAMELFEAYHNVKG